jgi:hypothetical protein
MPRTRKSKSSSSEPAKTRKQRIVATTIPELKHAFDDLEKHTATILSSSASPAARVKKFQEAWRSIFGRPVDAAAAEAYLQVKARHSASTRKSGGKRTRKAQKGGAAMGSIGAPLDTSATPGVYGQHGHFLPYLTKGLDFYDTINQQGMFKGCGIQDITPNVPVSIGTNELNQLGGGVADGVMDGLKQLTMAPIEPSSPPSLAFTAQSYFQGRALPPSPDPVQTKLNYMPVSG